MMRNAIGTVLRRERAVRGESLREVSGYAGLSLGYLSELERGLKESSSETLASVCRALDIEVGDLLVWAGQEMRES